MTYKCDICKEEYNSIDDIIYIECNGLETAPEEKETNDPDSIVLVVCNECKEYIK